jgi:hypothetical protein
MVKIDGNTNNVTFNLNEAIIAERGKAIKVQVLSASIPYSFYNINYSNKYLNVYVNHTNGLTPHFFTVQLAEGNYNAIEVGSLLQTALDSGDPLGHKYSIVYNKKTNKYTFNVTSPKAVVSFLFLTGTNQRFDLQYVLGFYKNQDYSFGTGNPLTSDSTANVSPYEAIYIRSNLVLTNQYDTRTKNLTDILCKIMVNNIPFSFIQYNPTLEEKYMTNLQVISNISFRLTDMDGDLVDLNNNQWFITLRFDVVDLENVFDLEEDRNKLIRAYLQEDL